MLKFTEKPKVMGVINVTPNSYYAASRALDPQLAITKGIQMAADGADILDIGGESTFPGSSPITNEEEIHRVVPVISGLVSQLSIPISIDTMKPQVADAALQAGATILNDISGFRSKEMIEVALKYNCTLCVMHMQGTPQTMQENPTYPEGVIPALLKWFTEKVKELENAGIERKKILLDPGIGFGKTVAQNHEIIHNLPRLKELGYPLLLGASRKLFIRKVLNKPPEEILAATIAMNTLGLALGADILRVHDVKEHRDVVDILFISQQLGK